MAWNFTYYPLSDPNRIEEYASMVVFASLPGGVIHFGLTEDVDEHIGALGQMYGGPVTRLRVIEGTGFRAVLPWLLRLGPHRLEGPSDQFSPHPDAYAAIGVATRKPAKAPTVRAASPKAPRRHIGLSASAPWVEWLVRGAESVGLDSDSIITPALAEFAERHGLSHPPPR